jgi:poly-beta-1,6-N-acetyl-D-glucosamine synthase
VTDLEYAVVTPARNEAENLRRLAASLAAQTAAPSWWVIVDNGSTDDTPELARSLAAELAWVRLAEAPAAGGTERGAPITRAFEAGVDVLDADPDVIVKVDADISFDPDHFARLLAEFAADPRLGIASGGALELDAGAWRPRYNTGASVWGAARAYRRACLAAVRPLEASMGWDGIDELKAQLGGWTTRTVPGLTFRHHRGEGARDGSPWKPWIARGRASHYMGYRGWYLALRALHHARKEPRAIGMLWGYATAVAGRRPVCQDAQVRSHLRQNQRIRHLATRRREAIGAPSR